LQAIVKHSFSRYCSSYEDRATVQKQVAYKFTKYSDLLFGNGIDLGCGTGFLTKVLLDKNIIGVDISKSMTLKYKENTKKNCLVADIQNLPFKEESFNFAVSSFALHWTKIDKSFHQVYKILKNKGYFVFSIPVEPSLEEFFQIFGKNFTFPFKQKVLKDLYFAGFKIEEVLEEEIPIYFKDGKDALNFFRLTGTAINKKAKTFKEKIKNYKILTNYQKPIRTKFNMLFVKAIKD
jgi:malonyl-CoA O-methyltransferase